MRKYIYFCGVNILIKRIFVDFCYLADYQDRNLDGSITN